MSDHGPVTIVGCTPHGHNPTIKHKLVALHHKLMSTGYKFKIVDVSKLLDDIASEEESCSSWRDAPAVDV